MFVQPAVSNRDSAPIGKIAEVHGPVAIIACDTLPPLRQALYAELDHEHCLFEVHQHIDEHHARYQELEDIITMLGMEELSVRDRKVVMRARKMQRYLTQPFWTTASHSGIAGVSVPLQDTLADCDAFLSGRYDERS
jgi:F0F1-type ATP synthase beta subunit